MGTLKMILTKISPNSKCPFVYESYKYEDIQPEWIIHQDHLHYLYNTTILGDSLFKIYRVVLARVPIVHAEDIIGLYLYIDEKKPPAYLFSLDRSTKIHDRCNKSITPTPKCFLFELKFIDKDKSEIFGTKDNPNRLIWVEKLQNVFSKPKPSTPVCDLPYLPLKPAVKSTDKSPNSSNQDPQVSYRPFNGDYAPQKSVVNDVNNNEQQSASSLRTRSDCNLSPYSKVAADDDYELSTNKEKTFVWNDIFYPNEKDDYKSILVKTNEPGAFLIRPQSKKTSSSDHDYTLCLYYQSKDIRCFGISQFPTRGNQYSLSKNGLTSFVDMVQLCQYYTINPLPMTTPNVYLKKPYKYYENRVYYIE